jgi:pyruvate kinase
MNFSHGSHAFHKTIIENTRAAEKSEPGRQIAIALDTKGPEIRTGNTEGDVDIPISAGTVLNFTTDEAYATKCDTSNVYVSYRHSLPLL